MQVAVVYSLPSRRMLKTAYGATDEDSSAIAQKVIQGLKARGVEASAYAIAEDRIDQIARIKADCIFNLIEWCGLDIELSMKAFGYLRKLEIPVTGSDERLFVLTGDKARLKQKLRELKVPTPHDLVMESGDEVVPQDLPYPVIVKPALEHCSMGLSYDSIARNERELREIAKRQIETWKQKVLAEEFIEGREFLVYLYEVGAEVKVLPIEEMIFGSANKLKFQTYEAKWVEGSADYNSTEVMVAKQSAEEKRQIEELCKRTFRALGLRGYARFDLRYRDGVPYILETNANPSVYDGEENLDDVESEVIWGIKFPDYLMAIVESAKYYFDTLKLRV